MTITVNAFFIAQGLNKRPTQGNGNFLDAMQGIDFQIAMGNDFHVDQAMSSHLIQHVVEKRQTGCKRRSAVTVEIDAYFNPGFERIALDLSDPWVHA